MHRTRSTDVGASQLIIDGKIKLKNDAQISNFTKKGLEFADGSTLDADVVVFATGLGEARDPMRKIIGPEAGAHLKEIWGLDSEGEIKGAWRDIGLPRLWCMIGNFALCRFHSKHVALRAFLHVYYDRSTRADSMTTEIKAIEEGLFDEKRYSLEE
jgi:hypothetical protein